MYAFQANFRVLMILKCKNMMLSVASSWHYDYNWKLSCACVSCRLSPFTLIFEKKNKKNQIHRKHVIAIPFITKLRFNNLNICFQIIGWNHQDGFVSKLHVNWQKRRQNSKWLSYNWKFTKDINGWVLFGSEIIYFWQSMHLGGRKSACMASTCNNEWQ